jgi:hypothetical protein
MKIYQQLPRFFSCFFILTVNRDPPEAVETDQVLKVKDLNFTPVVVYAALVLVDQAKVRVEAL